MRALAVAVLALVVFVTSAPRAEALTCERMFFESTPFDTCTVDVAEDDLRLWLDQPDGEKLLSLGRLADYLTAEDKTLAFAMNAGMYHEDRSPVGHLKIRGDELRRVITNAGPGNFGMLPNGVFCWGKGYARVHESRAYAKRPPKCTYATQSGPMLVLKGKLHPRFLPDSTSYRTRNGVGVSKDGKTAIFAISRFPVTFHHFARFFRDALKTPDALYLDGSVSRMYAPEIGRRDRGGRFGPMLGVVLPKTSG